MLRILMSNKFIGTLNMINLLTMLNGWVEHLSSSLPKAFPEWWVMKLGTIFNAVLSLAALSQKIIFDGKRKVLKPTALSGPHGKVLKRYNGRCTLRMYWQTKHLQFADDSSVNERETCTAWLFCSAKFIDSLYFQVFNMYIILCMTVSTKLNMSKY